MDDHAETTDAALVEQIACSILNGFNRHYRLMRILNRRVQGYFETENWRLIDEAARARIGYYDQRVRECVALLSPICEGIGSPDTIWKKVKLWYVGCLIEHMQPELAETFFNSVCTKLLHRDYYHNDYIFVRPAIATEYREKNNHLIYKVYYPTKDTLEATIQTLIEGFKLNISFSHLTEDARFVARRLEDLLKDAILEPNYQIQVLSNLFFRANIAYVIGKIINGGRIHPFVIAMMYDDAHQLVIDAVLTEKKHMTVLFSFTWAYFMVDMEVPSAYVRFLQSMLPNKPASEFYTMLGLQKHGKNLFYRDFLHHLKYSSDKLDLAQGIRGLVMLVFTLPSFPYVFKAIKDHFPASKETTQAIIKEKYKLVKYHDRVGRMADTWEYREVVFPKNRLTPRLLNALRAEVAHLLEETEHEIMIKHVYIERRMIPLNIWLKEAESHNDEAALELGIKEYGQAIKELVAANIFPGDMLYKNFGVTRLGRVVFYDYDEIEYLVDCQFRAIPQARSNEEEMAAEPWYTVNKNDVFPEQFGTFLLGNPKIRLYFLKHHADLLTPTYWQNAKEQLLRHQVVSVFPYPQTTRLSHSQ